MKTYTGWHFASDKLRDGQPLPKKGTVLKHGGNLVLCESGYHASQGVIDALRYAPGYNVARVQLIGEIILDTDKAVASERKTLTRYVNAEKVLHEYACWSAEQTLKAERKRGREPHPDSWKAIKIKRLWLRGKATDEELSAAESAAESAARSAARSAAWSAESSAASSAASSATGSAAWSAAKLAAESATRSAQNKKLTAMLKKLLEKGKGQ